MLLYPTIVGKMFCYLSVMMSSWQLSFPSDSCPQLQLSEPYSRAQ